MQENHYASATWDFKEGKSQMKLSKG